MNADSLAAHPTSRLRDRLRALRPAAAIAGNRLLRADRELLVSAINDGVGEGADQGFARWRFAYPADKALECAATVGPSGTAAIGFHAGAALNDIGERPWWDYADDARVLAWSLAHETLLGHVGRLLGTLPTPLSLQPAATYTTATGMTALGFALHLPQQEPVRGVLCLDDAALQRLAAHEGWRTLPADVSGWSALPLRVRLRLCPIQLPVAELRAAAVGDLLVVGARTDALSGLQLQVHGTRPSAAWLLQMDGPQRLRLGRRITDAASSLGCDQQPSYLYTDCFMNENSIAGLPPLQQEAAAVDASSDVATVSRAATAAPTANTEALGGERLGSIPVNLYFDLGALTLTLGELAALQPGHVFELPTPLDAARVTLRANGRAVGRGELVAVGNTLGVQLLELGADGP
jgi:type III secretion protein Q